MKWKIALKQKIFFTLLAFVVAALVLFFTNAQALFKTGNFFFGGKFYSLDRALFFYNRAIAVNPSLPGVHYQKARVYFLRSEFTSAIDEITKEIALDPSYKRSFYIRGLVYGYMREFKKAEQDFLTFLEWKPDSWAGHNDLSWVYFQEGDFLHAEKYAREGLTRDPHNPWLLNSLGIALLSQKKYSEAEKALEESLMVFRALPASVWGKAYPGNNERIYNEGYTTTLSVIEKNVELAKKGGK